jgi:hypothetical protein
MPTFNVTHRKAAPLVTETVEADSREHAIQAVVASVEEGGQIEVLQTYEITGTGDAGGATGATGPTGTW